MSSKRKTRALAVVAAVLAAVVVWVVARIAGVAIEAPMAGGDVQDVTVVAVVITSLAASLAGWALLAVLERFTSRPGPIWTGVALVVFLLSLAGPLTASGASASAKITLLLMHVAVAAVLVPVLSRTAGATAAATRTA